MTTLRESPVSKLGVKLQNYRADRPDEWTMDEFTREAELMALRIKELEAALLAIKNHQQALTPSGFEFSSVWQIADKALSE